MSLYQMVSGRPLVALDPYGQFGIFGGVLGGVIGGVVGGVGALITGNDVSAGIIGGATAGAIIGATGGVALIVAGGVSTAAGVATAAGIGAGASVIGNFVEQVIAGVNSGKSVRDAIADVSVAELAIAMGLGALLEGAGGAVSINRTILQELRQRLTREATAETLEAMAAWLIKHGASPDEVTAILKEIMADAAATAKEEVTIEVIQSVRSGAIRSALDEGIHRSVPSFTCPDE